MSRILATPKPGRIIRRRLFIDGKPWVLWIRQAQSIGGVDHPAGLALAPLCTRRFSLCWRSLSGVATDAFGYRFAQPLALDPPLTVVPPEAAHA